MEALCDKGSGFSGYSSVVESCTVCSCMLGRKHQCWECRQDKQASDKGSLCCWAESEQPRGLSAREKKDLTELHLRQLLPCPFYHLLTQVQSFFFSGLSQWNTERVFVLANIRFFPVPMDLASTTQGRSRTGRLHCTVLH